ncbi:MAG: DUF3488 and transglutaminase-like domain-containing protein [Planctomycetota bacterium]
MYNVRQFRPMLTVLLVVGFTGFAIALRSPGWWVLAVGGTLLQAWLVQSGRFRPMPRWIANIAGIVAFGLGAMMVFGGISPVLGIGRGLVLLQLVTLFEHRTNRDSGKLIVLSLLLMVASAISTASLAFGLLFIAYLFLSLYCCLLFHLKVETDTAKRMMNIDEDAANPLTLRQDLRHLGSSMRRLTGVVSSVAIVFGVLTFLLFPRGAGQNFLLPPPALTPSQTLTGLGDDVNFQDVARIQQNTAKVGYVQLFDVNDNIINDGRVLYLRASTLDSYDGDPNSSERWRWQRTEPDADPKRVAANSRQNFGSAQFAYRQKIDLEPNGTRSLIGIRGITSFRPNASTVVSYNPATGTLRTADAILRRTSYEVWSTDQLPDLATRRSAGFWQEINPRIREFVLRPEVSGNGPVNEDGEDSMGALRLKAADRTVTLADAAIAANVERYLQTEFTYTLDLTDAADILQKGDPLEAFLYDVQRGHCEYFAGAMALMLQSIGIDARVVIGFKADEFNATTDAYIVRQSHAHAWVEVRTTRGWQRYDPTSGREAPVPEAQTLWGKIKHLADWFEYTWADKVVAYDAGTRENLISQVDVKLQNSAIRTNEKVNDWKSWLDQRRFSLSEKLITGLLVLAVIAILGLLTWFGIERIRLRRRAKRIGIEELPADRKRRLARQLAFYDDLLRFLAKRGITRPDHLTPREFAASLTFLPAEAFDAVGRLTEIFYDVRFGQRSLTGRRRQQLQNFIEKLDDRIPA